MAALLSHLVCQFTLFSTVKVAFCILTIVSIMLASPPQPAGLRNCTAAAFYPLKKYAAHFFNHAFGVTG
jgi:hypothetical protein